MTFGLTSALVTQGSALLVVLPTTWGNQAKGVGSLRSLSSWAGLSDRAGNEGTERDSCRQEREPRFLEGL